MRTILAVCLFAASLAIGGCQSSPSTATGQVMNANCPFSGEAVDPKATADFGGQTIGFCCKRCASKFEAMDDAGKQAEVAKLKK